MKSGYTRGIVAWESLLGREPPRAAQHVEVRYLGNDSYYVGIVS